MSDVHDTISPKADPVESSIAATTADPEAPPTAGETTVAPVTNGEIPKVEVTKPETTEPTTVGTAEHETAPTDETKTTETVAPVEEKVVEPVREGQLAYKGPGLVKSLIPSKKEFWLSDDAVTTQDLHLYMRGEKPEVANPVVAWASQTGKGLLFFNRKGDTDRLRPAGVLDLYDATDLKKESPHQFAFKLHGSSHTFKASNDTERDGWFISIEKAIEIGKASKEEVHGSEGYKTEYEKLSKPTLIIGGAGSAKARSQSQPKKSNEEKDAHHTGSEAEDADNKKYQKSRSTSRGVFGRAKAKKDETEQKVAEKKEEKKEEKVEKKEEKAEKKEHEEKKEDKDEIKPSTDAHKAEEAGVVIGGGNVVGVAIEADHSANANHEEKPVETSAVKTEEKSKKRNSIFGKIPGWGGVKSPVKEKEQKDAELKPDVPPKDEPVSENPPQIPEAAATESGAETALPVVEVPSKETKTETAKEETVSPNKEKSGFLSGFIKRNRSVSPSTPMKEAQKKEESPVAATATEETSEPAVVTEPAITKVEEPVLAEPTATEAAAVDTTTTDKVEEPKITTDKAEKENRRQSVLGSLGRRASKALNRIQKKDSATTPAAKDEGETTSTAVTDAETEVKPVEETPAVNGETKALDAETQHGQIGDVVPEAVNIGHADNAAPAVAASA